MTNNIPYKDRTTKLNLIIDSSLLKEFEEKIKEHNLDHYNTKINKSGVIRDLIVNFIKKK